MKTLKALGIKILTVLLLLPALASAAPLLINYQGRLVDTAGNPLLGAQSILFSVYDAPSAGSLLWSETQPVTPDNGIFSVSLGSVSTLPASIFAADALYLEVKIGADAPLTPRTRLLSVPYAVSAANLGSPSSFVTVSTHIVVAASQLRLGNYAAAPATAIGNGAMFYNSSDNLLYYYNGTTWTGLAAGGLSPWGRSGTTVSLNTAGDKVTMSNTGADALTVSGGIVAGSGSVGIVGADGRIPALSSTYLASLNGSALTGLTAAQVGLGSVNNTADADKPVSTLQQAALDLKANASAVLSNTASISPTLVDLSTVTAELAGKLSNTASIPQELVNLSTVTSALALKADASAVLSNTASISPTLVDLSTVTAELGGKLSNTASISPTLVDLSTVTTELAGKIGTGLASANIFVGNGSGLAAPVAVTGDISITNAGLTAIGSGKVLNAMLADDSVTRAKLAADTCTENQILKLNASGDWVCATDVAGAGAMSTKEGDVVKTNETSSLDFEGAQFGVTDSPAGEANVALKSSSVTLQGNTFNGANNLVMLNASGYLPALNGSLLTNLASANLAGSVPTTLVNLSTVTSALDGKLGAALTDGYILVGNVSDVAAARVLSGDATIANDGTLTIATDAIITDKIQDQNVTAVKLADDVAGPGIIRTGLDGTLEVGVDGITMEINVDAIRVKEGGIDTANLADNSVTGVKLGADVAGAGMVYNGLNYALDVNVDNATLEVSADTLIIKNLGVTDAKIAGMSSTKLIGSVPATHVNLSTVTTALDAKAILADVSADTMTLKGLIDGKQASDSDLTAVAGL
ncbi:MAG: hypothetical protein CVU79_09595, partial [Elusimicrobia bacterium HGW-Elusimicrobia-3]